MSSAGRTKLAYIKEATYGTMPTSPDMKALPYNTGDAFANSRDTLTSGRVQSTRSPRQTRLGTNSPEKGLTAELVYATFDELIAAGLGDQWEGGGTVTDTVTVAATTITLDAGNWSDYYDEGVRIGAYLLFDDDGTLKPLYISNIATNVMTVQEVDEATSPALTIASSVSKTMIFGWNGFRLTASVTDTITFSASALTVTLASGLSGSWATLNPGENIYFYGTVSNDGWHKVASISGDVLTLVAAPVDETINTAVDVDLVTDAGRCGNGNSLGSFSMEEQFLDHNAGTGNFRTVSGVKVGQFGLSFQPSAFVELTLQMMGSTITAFSSSTVANSVADPADKEGFDTFTGEFNLAGVTACISGFDITLNNANNRNFCLFDRNAAAMTDGIPEITGNINAYFDDNTYTNAFFNETAFAPFMRMVDADGNAYGLKIGSAKFTGDAISIGDIDVTEALPFAVQPVEGAAELYLYRQPVAR